MKPSKKTTIGLAALVCAFIIGLAWTGQTVLANSQENPAQQTSPIHPSFPMLDQDGNNVLDSGEPVSTMNTCGSCHDTVFIESHSFHADVGLSDYGNPGSTVSERPWDSSPGLFGNWNPIMYRLLSPEGDDLLDLGTAEWLMTIGARHVGGGPAVTNREGVPLTELEISPGDPETHILDHQTGGWIPWDWKESGVVEMNCFLCHLPDPDNASRLDQLHAGKFKWANTATLLSSGIVEDSNQDFIWNPDAFDENGELAPEFTTIQDPTNENCGLCHGLVHDDVETPLVMSGCSPERWRTITTGQIISPQRLSDTGMNLADKDSLDRSWDIHAERLLNCTDCHYALNNPLYYQEASESRPDHLVFDPRRVEIGEYLLQPLHQFARGDSTQSIVAPDLKNTMRRCDSCHDTTGSHEWLPYSDRHMDAVSCESCHIPKVYSSANQSHDWTVIHLDGSPRLECRGVEGDAGSIAGLLTGYDPVWLPNQDVRGKTSLAPYNLITAFFWIYDDPPRPVRIDDLKAAYLEDEDYHPGVLHRFDANEDGKLDDTERVIDTPEKERFIANRLSSLGLANPRISGEIQAYSINHNVTNGEWAVRDCQVCHSKGSRINQTISLAEFSPGDVRPEFVAASNVSLSGEIITAEDGSIHYQPDSVSEHLYVLGQDSVQWIDSVGLAIFLATIAGILFHGGLRVYTSIRGPGSEPEQHTKRVYMYAVYERLWHWVQTFIIVLLIFTGLVIHRPDTLSIFSFRGVVLVHNILAVTLGVNAFLSLFYHLASGEIKQYIPRPRGFFDQSISQAMYYLRGIFKSEEHPFEKTPEKKLNPLQQVTYFAILNVLLPLQGITGILIWGAQRWPKVANNLGGLPFLSPFHTLIAWLFAAFIVLHVYLTTTGHKPLTGISAMINGWEDVEIHVAAEENQGSDNSNTPSNEVDEE